MFARSRSYWIATLATVYAAVAAIAVDPDPRFPTAPSTSIGPLLPWAALIGLPVILAFAWNASEPPARGEDHVEDGARGAARATFGGAAVLLAAQTGPSSPGFVALGNTGAAVASMGALVGLARIGSLGGWIEPPASSRRLEAAAFASLFWTVAVALPTARALGLRRAARLDPVFLDGATAAASLGALGLLIVLSARVLAARRLELGVAERARACLWVAVGAATTAVLSASQGAATPERALPFASVLASAATVSVVLVPNPSGIARTLSVGWIAALAATPVSLAAFSIGAESPRRAGPVILAACAASAIGGLAASPIARRIALRSRGYLRALEQASRAADRSDADLAIDSALAALGDGASLIKLGDTPAVTSQGVRWTVDRGGYRHADPIDVPTELARFADREPERVLRLSFARAVEVRHPEMRAVATWLEARAISAVAVIRDGDTPLALVALPKRAARPDGPALDEVRALRALADRLGAMLAADSALARSRDRELAGRRELERVQRELALIEAARDRDAGQRMALARLLERPARAAAYSPTARSAVEQIERLAAMGAPVALLAPPGIDVIAWAALAHLASPRRTGPLAIADGTSAPMHDLLAWRDAESSPLTAARGGTLAIIDAHALPLEVQSYVGAALSDELGVVVSLPATVGALAARGKLSERLADRLGDRAVALPSLERRAEDVRALALEHLARIGARLGRDPLGLSPRALRVLLEHDWPANDAELHAILLKAALVAEGAVLTPQDLGRAGLGSG